MHIHTIQLNIEKVLGGCVHMDAVEFGAYMSLIISCYQSKNKLPKDDKRLSRMARVSPHKWGKIKHVVLEKFTDKGDFYEQNFVKKDIQRIESLSKKNKANALKRNNTIQPVAKRSQSQIEANTSNKEQITNNNIKEKINKKEKVSLDNLSLDHVKDWLTTKRVAGKYLTIDEHRLLEKFKDYCRGNGKRYKDYVAAFRNAFEWQNAPTKGEINGRSTQTANADAAIERAIRDIEAQHKSIGRLAAPEL